MRCLQLCLRHVSRGGHVLDLPCGTGRLIPHLIEAGFEVTAADSSPRMLERAEALWQDRLGRRVQFTVREALDTGYAADTFDGVVCHRLLHHFNEPALRVAVLKELSEICRGPLIISYFNSFALDALKFRLKHTLRGSSPDDRVPISTATFDSELTAAGLQVIERRPVLWGLSPMWFLVVGRP
ncbi:MAG: class I SAM-dependent methyltransferase [Planctomycetaceae bacterium]|nr:class I SAM-dependent methyltransferase [Planctomycetaceae bacterium]